MRRVSVFFAVALVASSPLTYADESRYGAIDVERLEHLFDDDRLLVDVHANYGSDEYQFLAKLEGEDNRDETNSELQLLLSKPWSAYFDLQLGIEVQWIGNESTLGAVAGFEGVAPYRVETNAYVVISEDGDFKLSAELERDLMITQRIILQPRLDVHVEDGSGSLQAEVRARYELTRKFSPYIGVSWQRAFGDAATRLRIAGDDENSTTAIAGLRFWF